MKYSVDKSYEEYKCSYGDIPDRYSDRIQELTHGKKKFNGEIFKSIQRIENIKWETVRLRICLEPKATPRPRYSGASKVFYVKDAADNRRRFKRFMDENEIPQIITPMKFMCISYFDIPSSANRIERILCEMGLIRPISKPDWDNLGKTYSDMIQEQLILDDSLIIEGTSKKFYSSKPHIDLTITYMTEFDSIYNQRKVYKCLNKERK